MFHCTYINYIQGHTHWNWESSLIYMLLNSVPTHLSDQGIIIIAIVDDRQWIKRLVTKEFMFTD